MKSQRLLLAPRPAENLRTMGSKERFEDLLRAFGEATPREDLTLAECDAMYSEAVSSGLISEAAIAKSFDELLDSEVDVNAEGGDLVVQQHSRTIAECVRAYRLRRKLGVESAAKELGLPRAAYVALEDAQQVFDAAHLQEDASTLSIKLGTVTVSQILRVLQQVRVTLGLGAAAGTALLAARRHPPP